ncbi:MAG: hypothetical protein ACRDP6_09080 [Actinoallomurus sp.]
MADLLAPGGGALMQRHRPLISRLVADATAPRLDQYAQAAAVAGIPFLVDPLTHLLQGPLREEDPWAALPYGRPDAANPSDLRAAEADHFVEACVRYQIEQGATTVIPPYAYSDSPTSPWFERSVEWLGTTARAMRRLNLSLPVVPVFCGAWRRFAADEAWDSGLGRFLRGALDIGPSAVALCLSPAGDGKEHYHKLYQVFDAATRAKRTTGTTIVAWRQGVYGGALVAAGLDGYETGIGTSERANLAANIQRRKPRPDDEARARGGASANVFLEPFGRSVPSRVATPLLANLPFRAKVGCTDPRCCPQGVESTLGRLRRAHAVRARARQLAELDSMPASEWRLNHIGQAAKEAETLAVQANRILEANGLRERIQTPGFAALAAVTDEFKRRTPSAA